MSGPFFQNVVVITGASSGIGEEIALQLADQGAWLVLAARRVDRLEAIGDECRGRGGRALAVATDVTDEDQCRALIERAVAEYGRIDTLINNAGVSMWARFDQIEDLGPFDTIMSVNYTGSVYCTRYALPHLKETGGRLVGIASLTGKTGVPERTLYAASKHAMAGFFDSLRIELRDTGVTVTMIYPGFVATGGRAVALGPDGSPMGSSPAREEKCMSVETCARLSIKAIARRRRERVMTARARFGLWLKLVAPAIVDRIAARAIRKGY